MRNVWCMLALTLAAGCVQVDYVGRKFAPVPPGQVRFYYAKSEVPAEKYTVIGRFTATSPTDLHRFETEYKVQNLGAEYGGDAVCLVREYRRPHSPYNSDIEEFGSPNLSKRKIPEEEKKRFGDLAPLRSDRKRRHFRDVRIYMPLKDRDAVNRELFR